MTPIGLTDNQVARILTAAEPLNSDDRGPFLEAVAEQLRGLAEPGDGDIHRAIIAAQHRFFKPPDVEAERSRGRWSWQSNGGRY